MDKINTRAIEGIEFNNWQSTFTTVNANSAGSWGSPDIGSIGITVDGGGNEITAGSKGFIYIPYDAYIDSASILADQDGDIVIDVKKSDFTNFPNTSSITAAAKPTLSSSQKFLDSTLTGWDRTINAGDTVEFVVDSAQIITRMTLVLKVTK